MLAVVSYETLLSDTTEAAAIEACLLKKGLIGVKGVPDFEKKCRRFIEAARLFSALEGPIKHQYTPDRNSGEIEGYETGAEWFKDEEGQWQIDYKKSSYYASIQDNPQNKWPVEVDLQGPYLELGTLVFNIGKRLLNVIGLNETVGLDHEKLTANGRMLHYQKEEAGHADRHLDWCGAHHDHGVFTGLVPAYYFKDGQEMDEPDEAGLYIKPAEDNRFQKISAIDKSILFFQVGEFAQLILNDRIKSTEHKVKKAYGIERFTFALFYVPDKNMRVRSTSKLNQDLRYINHQADDGSISYRSWEKASYEKYRASKA